MSEWRALYPFEGRYHIHPDGHRQHYLDEGAGRPVLMLHGNPTWSFYYRSLVLGLRDRFRCVVPDHIGCGLSDKPQDYPYRLARHVENAVRLVDALDLRDLVLVVHDWGGAIGMGVALARPERVARLVVTNTAAFRSTRCPWRIRVCRGPLLGALAVRGANAFVRAATAMASARPLPAAVRAGMLAPYDSWAHRVAIHRFVADIPLSPDHPSYPVLKGIEDGLPALSDRPMMILWGLRDWCFSAQFLEGWRARFPAAEVHAWDDVHHLVLEDAPERALPLVARFAT